jgi:phosphatidylserine/phosphatidylglycerophosphate/cardiolipin synthase-like enzyme
MSTVHRATRTATYVVLLLICFSARRTEALDQLCDSAFENCRTPLLNLINAETQSIDVGMWFMEDDRYAQAIVSRFQAGVSVRILMDPRASAQHPEQDFVLNRLKTAGIPMRKRTATGIEHWKIMIFGAQNVIYFGSANFSGDAFVYVTPYVNYVDETVYFTDNPTFINSFKTKFDDAWMDTGSYANYANGTTLFRRFPTYPIDPEVNVTPGEDFINRTVNAINKENERIDAVMYRIADERPTNAIINAIRRGVPIRLLVAPDMYHDPTRLDVSYHFDRLWAAGVPLKVTAHQGVNHGKISLLYGQDVTIFGSSNWTTPSGNSQHENNYFTTKTFIFNYFVDYFERRWNNDNPAGATESTPFVPEAPDKPVNQSPANTTTGVAATGVKLKWYGGPWAWNYDVYFGTDPNPPLFAAGRTLGPSRNTSQFQSFTLPSLKAGTTYYWKIVSRTAADLSRAGNVFSFTTAGSAPPPEVGPATIVLWTANIPSADVHGDWSAVADPTAAGGTALQNPDRGRAKIAPALASPANYFVASFNAAAGVAYHVWIRMNAGGSTSNDSVHVQFSDSVDAGNSPVARIGTTASFEPVQQNGSGAPVPHGWGWTDNGWGSLGANVYFASGGSHVLRIQQREDGPSIDQIVLSPDSYVSSAPGPHSDDATILPQQAGDGTPPPPPPPPPTAETVVLWTKNAADADLHGSWVRVSDAAAAGGAALRNPNANAAKIAPALPGPANFFEMSFSAPAQTRYHVWLRMKADSNSTSNDSVHVQFSDSLDASNASFAKIGTSSSVEPAMQSGPNGPSPHGWSWTDGGWDFPGPDVYFATSGTHVIRIQQREDGVTIDQIVLSPDTYVIAPPGSRLDDATILPASGTTPPPCSFTLNPTSQNVAESGGSGSTLVTASVSTCPWTAGPDVSWLTITNGTSGTGNGTVSFTAATNSGAARTGTLTIAGRLFTVNQAAGTPPPPTCTFTIAPTSQNVAETGGSGSTTVTASSQTCPWTAAPNASWLTITSGSSGMGDGTVTFDVAPNSGGARTGTLTVASNTFNVNQAGAQSTSTPGTVVLWFDAVPADQIHGNWRVGADSGAGSVSIWNPNANAAKVAPALASPADYFELTFPADSGKPYHVWIRMRAQSNSLSNDSVHMQFDNATDSNGAAYARIGTTGSAEFVLQNGPSGGALHSWGWTENGWGSLGPNVWFAASGTQRLRVQQREDGAIIDQIVISSDTYLTTAPGGRTDDTTVLPKIP